MFDVLKLRFASHKDWVTTAVSLWLALVFILSGCMITRGYNDDNEASSRRRVENLKPNVVQVISTLSNGKPLFGFGFVAGEIWTKDKKKLIIVTANHNIYPGDDPNIQPDKVAVVFYPCQGHGPVEAFTTDFIDEDADLTILEVDIRHCRNVSHFHNLQADTYAWRKRPFSIISKDESVWFIGRNKTWEIPKKGYIDSIDDRPPNKISVNISSVWNGSSGAPLINREGKIVGMICEDKMAGRALAVSAERIEYLLVQKWGLPFGVVFSSGPGNSKSLECDPENGPVNADCIRNNFGMRFIKVQKGSFIMGSPKRGSDHHRYDQPPHKVHIENDFYIQKTEVTQCQWKAVNGQEDNPAFFDYCGRHCPVENVSWRQVQGFIANLNSLDHKYQYRLPTEAEWEYACRKYMASDMNIRCHAETGVDSPVSTGKVMSFSLVTVNGNHVNDMIGNVREWCQDIFSDAPAPVAGNLRAVRGGGWDSTAAFCRCSARDGVHEATIKSSSLGFRLVIENIGPDDRSHIPRKG